MTIMKRVIGIVGPIASGKGVVIRLLKDKGYHVLSLSDLVRARAKEWGFSITRENLQNVGDSLRQKFGNAILAEIVAPEIPKNPKQKFVIDAIRNPAEVTFLKKECNAYIIGITASPKKRYELMKARGREYDPSSWEEFVKLEARDRGVGQEAHGQQVEKCLALADGIVENNGSLEDLEEKVQNFLQTKLGEVEQ